MSSPIICPKPYTTSNDDGAIPCGITYAEAIGYKNYQILRILAMSFCFPLLIITIIQCIRLIYYRGIRPIVQIHGMYAFMLASVASQAIRSVDPQGWSLTLHPIASQLLNDVSTCSILCTAFLVAMSWLKLMRQIAGKKESKIYQVAEWGMPCGLVIIVFTLCILQTQVHNPGTYVFTMAKYCVFVLFILCFTITLWTQGIPLFIALNQINGVSGSSKSDRDSSKPASSPSSPPQLLRIQTQPSTSALDAHLLRHATPIPLPGMQARPHQVNIEMIDTESTTSRASAYAYTYACRTGEERSSVTTTNATHSPHPSIFPEHIQPVRTSIIAHQHSNPVSPSAAAPSPSMRYATRTISTPSASASALPGARMLIPVPPQAVSASAPAPASIPSSSSHSSTGKKKAKVTRILKLIVVASCVSLATVGFQISRIVTDYRSKFDDRDRPNAVPVGTFGSIFSNILLGILEYLACIVILSFFRQMRGDGGHAYTDTQRQSKNITNTYTQQTRTL